MSNEELCAEVRAGRLERMAELLEQNRGFVHKIARGYLPVISRNRSFDLDDLVMAGVCGMIEAVYTWDDTRGKFLTIAGFYVKKEIRCMLRIGSYAYHVENIHGVASLSEPITTDDSGELTIGDMLIDQNAIDPEEAAIDRERRMILYKAVNDLPENQRNAIKAAYFGQGQKDNKNKERGLRSLRAKKRLIWLFEEYNAVCFQRSSVQRFKDSGESSVETAVMERERLRAKIVELSNGMAGNHTAE